MNRPVLRWFGGKYRLAKWIISHMPEHRVYVEPFGGAASVLMQKPRSYAEVYNDLDDSAVTFFRVLRSPDLAAELQRVLEMTPFSRREFELAHCYSPYPVEKARRLVVRSFMGFGADSASNYNAKTGFRSNCNRSGTTPAHDWRNYAQEIPAFVERLRGVVIENKDAFELMRSHDSEETLHYIDPPYWPASRRVGSYKHELNSDQHLQLLDFVQGLKGKVLLSGYSAGPYISFPWNYVTKQARADKAGLRTEYLWANFPLEISFEKPLVSTPAQAAKDVRATSAGG